MSLKKIFLLTALIIVGVALGMGLMAWTQQRPPVRQTASENWRPLPVGKHLAPVTVEISAPESLPERDDQEVEITGYITLNYASDQDLNFQWDLPQGATLVEGEVSDGWSHVQQGQTVVTKISVVGFSRQHRRLLSLEGFVQVGSNRLGNSATLASSIEGTMEEVAPAMMRAKQNDEAQVAEGKARRK